MTTSYERQAPPGREAELHTAELLAGVPLDVARRARALEIVSADVAARREIAPAPAGQPWAAWDQATALMAQRDAALEALCQTPEEREALAVNVAAQRRLLEDLRQRAERHQAGGPVGG